MTSASSAVSVIRDGEKPRPIRAPLRLAIGAYALYAVIWSVMWGPFYVSGSEFTLFLWPICIALLLPVTLLCLGAIITSARVVERTAPTPKLLLIGIVAPAILIVVQLPLLWFGNVFSFLGV